MRQVCNAVMALSSKQVKTLIPSSPSHWVGDAFFVKPVFNRFAFTNDISPFLMFDYAGPREFEPTSKRRGVGTHPHRGFETVTIAFQGEIDHADSKGEGPSIFSVLFLKIS